MADEFEHDTSRNDTDAVQVETPKQKFRKNDLISLVIADFDFAVPKPIFDALELRLKQNVFGYSIYSDELFNAIRSYYQRHHNVTLEKQDVFYTPGVVPGVAMALQATIQKGDGICMLYPEYPPFTEIIQKGGYKLNPVLMDRRGMQYSVNYAALEEAMKVSKAFIVSNPHNPTGTAFSREQLQGFLDLANKYNVYVFCDEIWADLVFKPNVHQPILELQQKNVFVYYAASKSFNIAGLQIALTVTKDPELERKFNDAELAMHLQNPNCFGIHGLKAALTDCDVWLANFKNALHENMQACVEFINREMPRLKVEMPQATSLLWIDFSALFKTSAEAEEFCVDCGVVLQKGCDFCKLKGEGMLRMQCGCCMKRLHEALSKMKVGYDKEIAK